MVPLPRQQFAHLFSGFHWFVERWISEKNHCLQYLCVICDEFNENPVLSQEAPFYIIICLIKSIWLVQVYIDYLCVKNCTLIEYDLEDIKNLWNQHKVFFKLCEQKTDWLKSEARGMYTKHGQDTTLKDKDVSFELPPKYIACLKKIRHAHINVTRSKFITLERVKQFHFLWHILMNKFNRWDV